MLFFEGAVHAADYGFQAGHDDVFIDAYDYGDVVDGARLRPLMCQGGVVETTNEGAIHHDEVCHGNDHPHNWS